MKNKQVLISILIHFTILLLFGFLASFIAVFVIDHVRGNWSDNFFLSWCITFLIISLISNFVIMIMFLNTPLLLLL